MLKRARRCACAGFFNHTLQLHLDRSRNETNGSDPSDGERLSEKKSETSEIKNSLSEQYEWKDTIGGSQVLQCGTSKVCLVNIDVNHIKC